MINPMLFLTDPTKSNEHLYYLPETCKEQWANITEDSINDIMPYYYISNIGRVYSTKYNKILTPYINNNYHTITFTKLTGRKSVRQIHRVEMECFYPINDLCNMQVNHIDHNKLNNFLSNLEWVTSKGNMIHSFQDNNRLRTEENVKGTALITIEQVHSICKMLEKQIYSHQEIADNFGCDRMVVSHISAGDSWQDISKNYNLEKRKSLVFTNREYDELYKYLSIHYNEDLPLYQLIRNTLNSVGIIYNKINYDGVNYIRKKVIKQNS